MRTQPKISYIIENGCIKITDNTGLYHKTDNRTGWDYYSDDSSYLDISDSPTHPLDICKNNLIVKAPNGQIFTFKDRLLPNSDTTLCGADFSAYNILTETDANYDDGCGGCEETEPTNTSNGCNECNEVKDTSVDCEEDVVETKLMQGCYEIRWEVSDCDVIASSLSEYNLDDITDEFNYTAYIPSIIGVPSDSANNFNIPPAYMPNAEIPKSNNTTGKTFTDYQNYIFNHFKYGVPLRSSLFSGNIKFKEFIDATNEVGVIVIADFKIRTRLSKSYKINELPVLVVDKNNNGYPPSFSIYFRNINEENPLDVGELSNYVYVENWVLKTSITALNIDDDIKQIESEL